MHRKAPIVMAREKLTHKMSPIYGKKSRVVATNKTKQTEKRRKMVRKSIPSESKTKFRLRNEARKKHNPNDRAHKRIKRQ